MSERFRNFFRPDLHLRSRWWHRLAKVLFVVATICIGVIVTGFFYLVEQPRAIHKRVTKSLADQYADAKKRAGAPIDLSAGSVDNKSTVSQQQEWITVYKDTRSIRIAPNLLSEAKTKGWSTSPTKLVSVDGQLVRVPINATLDEIDQIARAQAVQQPSSKIEGLPAGTMATGLRTAKPSSPANSTVPIPESATIGDAVIWDEMVFENFLEEVNGDLGCTESDGRISYLSVYDTKNKIDCSVNKDSALCHVDPTVCSGNSAHIVKYTSFEKYTASNYLRIFAELLATLALWSAVVVTIYYKGVIYIVFGSPKPV